MFISVRAKTSNIIATFLLSVRRVVSVSMACNSSSEGQPCCNSELACRSTSDKLFEHLMASKRSLHTRCGIGRTSGTVLTLYRLCRLLMNFRRSPWDRSDSTTLRLMDIFSFEQISSSLAICSSNGIGLKRYLTHREVKGSMILSYK
jgi:hypothetical protein